MFLNLLQVWQSIACEALVSPTSACIIHFLKLKFEVSALSHSSYALIWESWRLEKSRSITLKGRLCGCGLSYLWMKTFRKKEKIIGIFDPFYSFFSCKIWMHWSIFDKLGIILKLIKYIRYETQTCLELLESPLLMHYTTFSFRGMPRFQYRLKKVTMIPSPRMYAFQFMFFSGIMKLNFQTNFYLQVYEEHPDDVAARNLGFYKEIVRLTAELVAKWQCVGFCHG